MLSSAVFSSSTQTKTLYPSSQYPLHIHFPTQQTPTTTTTTTIRAMAERILLNEFKALSKEKWVNIELHDEDIFRWDVALIVLNPDSMYYGGYFKALMEFPRNYPYSPPGFRFYRPIWHPNIYNNGELCISILHAPGEDEMSGESAAERWSPAQRVESVLISILSLLDDAECSSPANVDAGVQLRNDKDAYKKRVQQNVDASKMDIPEGFVMPTFESTLADAAAAEKSAASNAYDSDFWADSGDDDDDPFGGSDSSDFGMDDNDDDMGVDESGDGTDDDTGV